MVRSSIHCRARVENIEVMYPARKANDAQTAQGSILTGDSSLALTLHSLISIEYCTRCAILKQIASRTMPYPSREEIRELCSSLGTTDPSPFFNRIAPDVVWDVMGRSYPHLRRESC